MAEPYELTRRDALAADERGDDLLETLRRAYGRSLDVGGLFEQLPRIEKRVTVDPTRRDDHGNPVPDVRWSIDDRVRATVRRANTIQHRILDELDVDITWTVGPGDTGPVFHPMARPGWATIPANLSSTTGCDLTTWRTCRSRRPRCSSPAAR